MKIGYPCLNLTIGCTSSRTFRIKNYSKQKLIEKITTNLECLLKTLKFNVENKIDFFRISSEIIPFASHRICTVNWQKLFKDRFAEIGKYINSKHLRISMHPDQFVILNSLKSKVVKNSIKELKYHVQVMQLLNLNQNCKIQIHVGGAYGDKQKSIARFIQKFKTLDKEVKKRLVIENDERSYSLKDCLNIHSLTKIPVLFDAFHHNLNNNGESLTKAINIAAKTWKKKDGLLMVDYSLQAKEKRTGSHTLSIDQEKFAKFLNKTKPLDFDIMLEIKDKEKSALKAIEIAIKNKRLKKNKK